MIVKINRKVGEFLVLENDARKIVHVIHENDLQKITYECGTLIFKQRKLGKKGMVIADNYLLEKLPNGKTLSEVLKNDPPVKKLFEFIRGRKIEIAYSLELTSGVIIRNINKKVFQLFDIEIDVKLSF